MWCIPKLTKEYRRRMYRVLDTYGGKYDKKHPKICIDEKSKQLLASTRGAIPGKPGSPTKVDYEYKRNGTRNIFVAVDPLGGRRYCKVTRRRGKKDFAYFVKDIVTRKYAKAESVTIILDNLNTHFEGSFYETFTKEEAKDILSKVIFVYTPKHASWLNMAEIEINVLEHQCLNRRIGTENELKKEVQKWQARRNRDKATINWGFTKRDAYNKMRKHYIS